MELQGGRAELLKLEGDLLDKNKLPLALAALYFLISSNFLGELFTCSLRKELSNNMITKHVLVFITLYISVIMTSNIEQFSSKILATLLVYIWFLITTKCSAGFVLTILIIICLCYCINEYITSISSKDPEKKQHFDQLKSKINRLVLLTSVILSIIGFVLYFLKQKKDHSSNFNYIKFIFGTPNCSN